MTHVARATILLEAGDDAAAAAYREWLARVRSRLSLVSDDEGCGCCVHLFDVEGDPDAIASIPGSLRCESARDRSELLARCTSLRDDNARAELNEEVAAAFRERRHADVVRMLAPLEGGLSDAQRAKLEYARRHQSRLRTWWDRLTRR